MIAWHGMNLEQPQHVLTIIWACTPTAPNPLCCSLSHHHVLWPIFMVLHTCKISWNWHHHDINLLLLYLNHSSSKHILSILMSKWAMPQLCSSSIDDMTARVSFSISAIACDLWNMTPKNSIDPFHFKHLCKVNSHFFH